MNRVAAMLFAITEIKSISDRIYLDNLYRAYCPMLLKLVNSIIRDQESAGDIVTNAMLSLFSLIPKLREMEERELVAYLRATVRNAAYKHYNAAKRKNITELPLDNDLLFSLPSDAPEPDELLIQDEEFQMVREAITALPERDRRVLHLKYAAGMSAEEIAKLTGAPSAAAVRERLSRARRRVLAQLEERGWADAAEKEHPGVAGTVGGPTLSTDR